ncbi:MAG: alpha/beta fold hydrolase [Pseudonocardiaceae bacterium]
MTTRPDGDRTDHTIEHGDPHRATTTQFARGKLVFDVTEAGPPEGEPVVLLHGFPQFSDSWDALVPLLTQHGYRTLAMDQRGYSVGARPPGRRAYRIPELVADVVALIDAHGGGPAHVVGHDWGAAVAWALTAGRPDKVRSLTALYVDAPYQFETLRGVSHWIPEAATSELAALLLPHLQRWS